MMRVVKLLALLAALASTAAAARADVGSPWGPETPPFNLQAILRPAASGPDDGFGLVKFRQPNDADKIVYLNVSVRNLAANHGYYLQRATDTSVDDDCTGTNWLTLGRGLTSVAITTDDSGAGRAQLFRDLAAFPAGMQFDIHFRVIDASTTAVVLESGCYQYTVSE